MILECFVRVFVAPEVLAQTVEVYLRLLAGEETMRFTYPEAGLELVAVSSAALSVLIIAGPADKRAPFEETRLTIKVTRLEGAIATLAEAGGAQLEPVHLTPVGRKTRFRHPDGMVVEYVDHD